MAVQDEVEVLVVGGGPVGLTARALLERWGVRTLLVEKRRELSPFPRSRLVNVRSMEIYRQLGLADGITARAFAPEFGRVRFRERLHDPDVATVAMIGIDAPIPESPALGVVTSQDRLEPALLAAAEAPVRFGVELAGLTEDAVGVVALLGDRTRVRARYLVAADGANSTVRRLLGIQRTGPGTIGGFTTVVFDADLSPWCAGQPAGVYFTTRGSFAPLYPEGGWAWIATTPEDDTDCAALVTDAIGSDAHVDVVRVQHWEMNAFVADQFRHGRVLLAGDAAHAVPIVGGLGMNAGVGDVHNLCWKLAGVLRGWAGPSLLETYEAERHPVAHETLRQAVANTRLMLDVLRRRSDGEPAEGELPWSDRYFAQLGLVLGVAYDSTAVLTNGSSASGTGTDYVPTTEPGHRMPHLWLGPDRSTLDAVGEWFTLLTQDPASWTTAGSWPLRVVPLPDEHAAQWHLGPRGALLVRPDGHIGARWGDRPAGDSVLDQALGVITARHAA